MKFLQVSKNVMVHSDAIEAVVTDTDGSLKILTATRQYTVSEGFVENLLRDDIRADQVNRLTTQFFGG